MRYSGKKKVEISSNDEFDLASATSLITKVEVSEEESGQEKNDQSTIFDQKPDELLAASIEDNFSQVKEDIEDIDVPSFGETEVAAGEELDDEDARVIIDDVVSIGNEQQVTEAKIMVERMFPSDQKESSSYR